MYLGIVLTGLLSYEYDQSINV